MLLSHVIPSMADSLYYNMYVCMLVYISHTLLKESVFACCMWLLIVGHFVCSVCVQIAVTVDVKASCLLMTALLISWLLRLFWTPWKSEGANTSEDFTVGEVSGRHLAWPACVCVHEHVCGRAKPKMKEAVCGSKSKCFH